MFRGKYLDLLRQAHALGALRFYGDLFLLAEPSWFTGAVGPVRLAGQGFDRVVGPSAPLLTRVRFEASARGETDETRRGRDDTSHGTLMLCVRVTMGAALDIYRLYRWRDDHRERLILAKATRPEFPNWSQPAEEVAVDEVDARFAKVLTNDRTGLPLGSTEFIAAWEGGYPDGDVFYTDTSGLEVALWLAFDTVHNGYFVFGVQADEACFWESLREMSKLGEVCDVAEYSRPAQRVTVLFVQ